MKSSLPRTGTVVGMKLCRRCYRPVPEKVGTPAVSYWSHLHYCPANFTTLSAYCVVCTYISHRIVPSLAGTVCIYEEEAC